MDAVSTFNVDFGISAIFELAAFEGDQKCIKVPI